MPTWFFELQRSCRRPQQFSRALAPSAVWGLPTALQCSRNSHEAAQIATPFLSLTPPLSRRQDDGARTAAPRHSPHFLSFRLRRLLAIWPRHGLSGTRGIRRTSPSCGLFLILGSVHADLACNRGAIATSDAPVVIADASRKPKNLVCAWFSRPGPHTRTGCPWRPFPQPPGSGFDRECGRVRSRRRLPRRPRGP